MKDKQIVFERHFNSQQNEIVIRSLKNKDLSFYKEWYMKEHFKDTVKEKEISGNELEKLIAFESKEHYIFIVEIDNKPIGEIIVFNKRIGKKPKLGFKFQMYEEIKEFLFIRIFNLFSEEILRKIDKDENPYPGWQN